MDCRKCGVCCTAISISSPIPGMPAGKPAGVRCIHLKDNDLCNLFGTPERPPICTRFNATYDFCGDSAADALHLIEDIEHRTKPE